MARREQCGFCDNGKVGDNYCYSCNGTGEQLTPDEWWEVDERATPEGGHDESN